jgi:hypothetical protein
MPNYYRDKVAEMERDIAGHPDSMNNMKPLLIGYLELLLNHEASENEKPGINERLRILKTTPDTVTRYAALAAAKHIEDSKKFPQGGRKRRTRSRNSRKSRKSRRRR